MKKKIAVFGNGWSNEYLMMVISGIRKCAIEHNVDIFFFMDYSSGEWQDENVKAGEMNIFTLPDLGKFDGVILLANTFHLKAEYEYLINQIFLNHIPAVSLEYELEGIDYLGTDNYSGMFELTEHLLKEHHIRNLLFMSGPKENLESMARKQAVEDAIGKYGLALKTENIIYGDWSYDPAQEALLQWMDKNPQLPDAIICANDVMAMAVCTLLEKKGINVPGQVKVTGYDRLISGIMFSPVLTSVGRNWDDIGYRGIKHLLDRLEGKEVPRHEKIVSKAEIGESCGCKLCRESKKLLRAGHNMGYNQLVDNVLLAGRMCGMAEFMSDVKTPEEFHLRLNEFWSGQYEYGVSELYLCLNEHFFSSLKTGDKLEIKGYSDDSDLICGLRDGKMLERKYFKTNILVPDYDEDSIGSHMYTFLPVYRKKESYGYIVFGNEVPMLFDYSMNTWVSNLELNIERVRQNLKMEDMNRELVRLSLTDALSGLYNRMACEKLAYPFMRECHKAGKNCALLFADINKMKVINDRYGHYQGDLAICTMAEVLKEVLPKDWIILRYGGDEFMASGECGEEAQLEEIKKRITDRLKKKSKALELPYTLKAGVGFWIVREKDELDLADCLKRADEAMYSMKEMQHQEK